MSKPTVYLAGPISGLSYGDANDWRTRAISRFAHHGIVGLNPLRGKNYLEMETSLADVYANPLSTEAAITGRDRWDTTRCDIVMMNLLGAKTVSIGTMIEAGWADLSQTPVMLVIEDEGNLHDHAMLRNIATWRTDDVNAAVEMIVGNLA